MKSVASIISATLFVVALYSSCTKNNSTSSPLPLTLSNSSVQRGQPLVAIANTTNSGMVIKWSVSPVSNNTWISSTGNKSVILFSRAGSYTVTANFYTDSVSTTPVGSSTSPVTVTDSIYNDSSGQRVHCDAIELVPLNSNDQVNLTPVSYSDTRLVLVAHTQQTYGDEYPLLNYTPGPDSVSGYEFVFSGVSKYPCGPSAGADLPGTAIISFSNLSIGTSEVTFILNGTSYKGSVTVTTTSCTFTWNYTSGVIISPLTIQKQ